MTNFLSLFRKIYIHPLLWVVVAIAVMTAHFIELSLLLFIIFIHEFGHAAAASFFSWRVKKISILPFGGVAEMDEHGNRPLKEEAIVTLAGPIQHLWLIAVALLLNNAGVMSEFIFTHFIQFNLMIFMFNLLPIWPLDGGKFIFLWLSLRESFPKAFKQTLMISIIVVFVFTAFMLLIEPINLNLWIVVSYIIFTLRYEWKQSRYIFIRFLMERYYGKKNELRKLKPLIVEADDLVIHVLERFQRGYKHPIIVEKDGNETGSLDENELLHAYFAEKQITAKIGDLLYPY
ncbi:M50 family metallopeptidase [Robertmurraya sp. DFI.2.37]|uniref:M50 family metallopeptidase n=1 Tax=Robertmurraya sp. DFI.2.37 TaxID=3031819 RepID=UPI00124432EB|nr:M50 family metallopeptidase [Robertmurraya sp. DFI.2.37]MDF1506868.1 M50 family metallopeptidase [Robertmurraya sp. DFI.2.37]